MTSENEIQHKQQPVNPTTLAMKPWNHVHVSTRRKQHVLRTVLWSKCTEKPERGTIANWESKKKEKGSGRDQACKYSSIWAFALLRNLFYQLVEGFQDRLTAVFSKLLLSLHCSNSWTQDCEDCLNIRPHCKHFMHSSVHESSKVW